MNPGNNCFYFLSDDYYEKFNGDGMLMTNKKDGRMRPCFYAFKEKDSDIYWLIPISSKLDKYKPIYEKKISKSKKGECDTIQFGFVWGKERAFLIQNMCPATDAYFVNEYIKNESFVKIDIDFEKELIKKAKKILRHVRAGRESLVYPKILKIEKALKEENR